MAHEIRISVIIPVKNGAETLDACLKGIFKQTLISQTEVIVIDSGSADASLEIIKNYPVRLFQIKPEDFGHGKTRNYGVSLANGEFVVMTVQDARPASDRWLEIMLQHFSDPKVTGVCGQQAVPHEPDKNPLQWYRPVSAPGFNVKHFPKGEFQKLTAKEQWQNCRWDDVNAMYRKTALQKIPFADVAFGEDMIWAKTALSAGHKIIYDKTPVVWHYHHYTNKHKLRQRVQETYFFTFKTFNHIPPNPYPFKKIFYNLYLCLKYKAKPYWWIYNLRINFTTRSTVKQFMRNAKTKVG